MFNGIIKFTGKVNKMIINNNNCVLEISSKMKFLRNELGSSIACSGVCLTLEKFSRNKIKFYVSKETINRTNFKYLKKGEAINLEKSMKYGNRISGHFVQGHVDTTALIERIDIMGKSWCIFLKVSRKFKNLMVEKGSITINGVSLTISKILKYGFQIVVVPQTLKMTNLIFLKKRDVVNIEFDVLGKYIKSFVR